MKNNDEVVTKSFFSHSFETKQTSASTYLAVTGIVLSTSVLTISDAEARGISPISVVIYEGEPVDYSNRDDVIFIDDSSYQNSYSNVSLTPNDINTHSSMPKTVVNQTKPNYQAKPQIVSKALPTQPKAKYLKVKRIDPIAQVELSNPFNKFINNTEVVSKQIAKAKKVKSKDHELDAFYTNVLEMQRRDLLKQSAPSIKKPIKQLSSKNFAQKKSQLKSNEIQLALKNSKDKAPQLLSNKLIPNKPLNKNMQGKDPELVAFYMDVFAKQNNNLSNQSIKQPTVIVKQISVKNIAQKNTKIKKKANEVQLAIKTSKAKDPELVAFYQQVFDKDTKSSEKDISVVATVKAKDPELVAFYEREFGKSTNSPLMPVLTNKVSSKVNVAASSKSDKKRMAKKIVKKAKVKTTSAVSTELAELQELIDDLTSKNII